MLLSRIRTQKCRTAPPKNVIGRGCSAFIPEALSIFPPSSKTFRLFSMYEKKLFTLDTHGSLKLRAGFEKGKLKGCGFHTEHTFTQPAGAPFATGVT